MNISVDGGGICLSPDKTFGNFTFSENLLHALDTYDTKNNYTLYVFKNYLPQRDIQSLHVQPISPQRGWMKIGISIAEILQPKDIFLAVNQALPLYASGKIITFSHGLSYIRFPHMYKENLSKLYAQCKDYVKRSDYIIVSSERVKDEYKEYVPECSANIIVLPCGVPSAFQTYEQKKRERFFMFSGMNHPIKNIDFLVQSFNHFIQDTQYSDFKLYLIGASTQYATESIIVIPHANHTELREYYQKATAYLTASHYESFNFPVLEALSQQCPVIGLESAIIPEMHTYCHIVNTQQEFILQMKEIAQSTEKISAEIDLQALYRDFSWEEYVKQLVTVYNV